MKWEPIDTAPMDGTWVLVTGFKLGKIKTLSHLYAVAAWHPKSEVFPHLGGDWYFAWDDKCIVREPKHWCHLPMVPPKRTKE